MSLSNAPIADDFHADTPHRRSELRSGMRHVLVFAKTPYAKTPYDRWLAGSVSCRSSSPPPSSRPGTATCRSARLRRLRHQSARREDGAAPGPRARVTAVFARAEADVIRAAQLRDLLDLPGQRTASALAFRDKVVMKDHLVGGPVEVPPTGRWIRPTPPWSSSRSTATRGHQTALGVGLSGRGHHP